MPIDLATQRAISASEAAKHFPSARLGRPCHVSRVIRAIVQGTPVPGGRVYLAGLKLGSQWVTTVEAIEDYGAAVAEAIKGGRVATQVPSSAVRTRSAERAGRELDALGI